MIENIPSLRSPHHLEFLSNFNGRNVFYNLDRELNSCDQFYMSVAFITKAGITPFLQTLKELEEKNVKGMILTTDYLTFSDPHALDIINNLKNIELRMYETNRPGNKGFHTKGYIFKNGEYLNIIIGSSNITQGALFRNYEWNVRYSADNNSEYTKNILNEFNELWKTASDYASCRERYKEDFENKERTIPQIHKQLSLSDSIMISPNNMQKSFISNLNKLIEKGKKRALLISATGTGKTYASAFAIKELLQKNPSQKVLFVSHREQINKQALISYKKVMGEKVKMGMLSGNHKDIGEAKSCQFLFSTMQTLSKFGVLSSFDKKEYSIIVLDECHRVGADSYQRIIDYFDPKLLLGMSASPERSDSFDVFNTFDYNIAYEIRLQQALEHDLLCPFHYFGITDLYVDDIQQDVKDFNKLVSDERVDYIIDKANYYGHVGEIIKGLIFCSTQDEAKGLSEKFNNKGFHTIALTGADSQDVRMNAIDRLETDDAEIHLDYIFTVDIFNEGVDIPQINQILLLRPTESPIIFVQQIGRGLRKFPEKEYVVILDFIGNYNNNYMIPIALSGDRSGNKDNMRRCLQEPNEFLNGVSTIHFDSISKQRIYESIDTAPLNTARILKNDYLSLKMKLGRIPMLKEFDLYGELDPLRIIRYSESYHNFLKKYDADYHIELNPTQNDMIDFISTKLVSGKRIQELLLLQILIHDFSNGAIERWKTKLKTEFDIVADSFMIQNVINVMSNVFYNVGSTKGKYERCLFVTPDGDIHPDFAKELNDSSDFKNMMQELILFGIERNKRDYSSSGNFILYRKYTYDDVSRISNWEKDVIANSIGGYWYDEVTNTCPVFINYDKAEDIDDGINYEDRFVDQSTFLAISKKKRTLSSPDVKRFINAEENNTKIHLFLRKNKDDKESFEFYYLGRIRPTQNFKEIKMKEGSNAVEIEYKLDRPIPDSLYDYFNTKK